MLRHISIVALVYWSFSPFGSYTLADDFRGGDAIVCEPTPENGFAGMYNLDYLLTYNSLTNNSDVPEASSVEASLDRIADKVRVIPKLYDSIRNFIELSENYIDYTQERIWEIASFGLIPITDRPVLRRLPPNCYNEESATANIVQAIVKASRGDHGSTYLFDPEVLAHLEATSPLQLSFMLTHEWLWDFTDDVLANRRATRFLHSTASAGLSADELKEALEGIGLVIMTPICRRSETVRKAIEDAVDKECHEISRGELATIDTLKLRIDCDHLRADDFEGLTGLGSLEARGIGLKAIPPGLEQTRIRYLDLSANDISALDRPLPPNIGWLILRGNDIAAIPAGFLEGYGSTLRRININSNRLETFTYIGRLVADDWWPGRVFPVTYDLRLGMNNIRTIKVHNVSTVYISGNPLAEREFRNIREIIDF